GDFEQEVSHKENARTEAVHRIVKWQSLLHLQLRIPDVDAVQISDHVGDQQQRYEMPVYFREHGLVSRVFQCWRCPVCSYRMHVRSLQNISSIPVARMRHRLRPAPPGNDGINLSWTNRPGHLIE